MAVPGYDPTTVRDDLGTDETTKARSTKPYRTGDRSVYVKVGRGVVAGRSDPNAGKERLTAPSQPQ